MSLPHSDTRTTETIPLDVLFFGHFVRQLDVRIAVTEASHIRHLGVRELQQSGSVFILHLHDVKDALYPLMKRDHGTMDSQRQSSLAFSAFEWTKIASFIVFDVFIQTAFNERHDQVPTCGSERDIYMEHIQHTQE